MGFGVFYIMMDSNKSINVVSKFQQQQKAKTNDGVVGAGSTKYTDPKVEVKEKTETKDNSLENILKEANEQANKAINDLQEAINTTDDDTSEKEGGIGKLFTDWWWVLVGLYFFRGIFTSGS